MTTDHLSPRDFAAAIGVSESSIKRWVDSGALIAERTEGGHRRIARSEALRFVRDRGYQLKDPGAVGIAVGSTRRADAPELDHALYAALRGGDEVAARELLVGAFLAGSTVAAICDGPLRQAMRRLGELWQHGPEGIAIEHAATSICLHALERLRHLLPDPSADAPVAVGGAMAEDPYLLPSLMAATTLVENDLRAINLGGMTPDVVLDAAVANHRPVLVWRALSYVPDPDACAR